MDKMDEILKELHHQLQQQRNQQVTRSALFGLQRPLRRYEADGSEEEELRLGRTRAGNHQYSDPNLATKYKELEQAEQRLKQIELIMKLIEQQEREINEHEGESHGTRKASNEETCYKQPGSKNVPKEPKNIFRRNEQMSGRMPDLSEPFNGHPSPTNCSDNRNIHGSYGSSFEMPFDFLKDCFMQSMQTNYTSMQAFFENCSSLQTSSFMTNQQFFYLMLMQNYQMLQQQQMWLLMWLQNQQSGQHSFQPCDSSPLLSPTLSATSQNQFSQPRRKNHGGKSRQSNLGGEESTTLNNQVAPGNRPNNPSSNPLNNYWDNFKNSSRQNQLSNTSNSFVSSFIKSNENYMVKHPTTQNSNSSLFVPTGSNTSVQTHNQELHNAVNGNFPSLSSSLSRLKKAANASQHEQNGEKVQNTFTYDSPISKSQAQADLNALYAMLEKFMSNEDKVEGKSTSCKLKSTNLVKPEEDGAVGGEIPCAIQNCEEISDDLPRQIHIAAATGAIRKKPKNQEILETNVKQENNEDIPVSETIRPLMAAEGRPSEIRTNQNKTVSTQLFKRPPTTGATNMRECENEVSNSSDEDLAEADRTGLENANELDVSNLNSLNIMNGGNLIVPVVMLESSARADEEEADDEEDISVGKCNDTRVRLSGDGEQGL